MDTLKSWERSSAPVEGYIVPPDEGEEHPVFPSGRVLAGTASTGGLIGVEEAILAPGFHGPYRHYHPNVAELFYVLEGEVEFTLGKEIVVGRSDTFVLVPGGVAHTFGNAGTTQARLLVMHAPAMDAYFEELQTLWSQDIPPNREEEMALMRLKFERRRVARWPV